MAAKFREKARLFTAYEWVCDDCGKNNFCSSIKADLSREEMEKAFRALEGFDDDEPLPDGWENFELCTYPNTVRCQHCGGEFQTESDRNDGMEDLES